jgi:hypothetical protein
VRAAVGTGAGSSRFQTGSPGLQGARVVVRFDVSLPNPPLTSGSFKPRSFRDVASFDCKPGSEMRTAQESGESVLSGETKAAFSPEPIISGMRGRRASQGWP